MRKVTISTSWVIRLLAKLAANTREARERIIGIAHKQVVVFNTERPVRCEAVLETNTDGGAPAGRAGRGQVKIEKVIVDGKAVVRHRRTALYVEQRLIPSVADLAGKEADAIGRGARGEQERRIAEHARAAEIRPIALGFHAKHPLVGLPTVADLAADDTSGPRGAAVTEVNAKRINEIQAAIALTPATVAADVEAGPVVNRGYHRRRRPCLDSHISGRSGSAIPRASKPTVPSKNFFITQSPFVTRFVEATIWQECPSNFQGALYARFFAGGVSEVQHPRSK